MKVSMDSTPFVRLALLGEQLEQTSKRLELTALLADFLRCLAPEEIPPAVRLIIGQVFPEWDDRALDVSWKTVLAVIEKLTAAPPDVRERVAAQAVDGGEAVRLLLEQARLEPPNPPPLSILEVFHAFEKIAAAVGKGSRASKESLLRDVLARATPLEAKYLVKVIYQEMRHGVNEGIMLDGIVKAAGVKAELVRRAHQFWGDLGEVALVALTQGETGLKQATVSLFRPIKPMLAQTAESLAEAFESSAGRVALEYKLDGARVQIHRRGNEIRIYSRHLADVTASLPDVVAEVRDKLAAEEAILEGEAVAVDDRGRPLPFQHLMRRFRRKHDVMTTVREIPIQLYLFDALYVDGRSLVDAPCRERWTALEKAAGKLNLVRRLIPQTMAEGEAFVEAADRDGHEGVMAKDLDSTYTPGVRGKSWLKLKHAISLDLIIVAADWGYGRRHGWLSNYHLAARDAESGEYLLVGKTFKGLTDAEFEEMTERLLALERSRQGGTVFVQPQVVVEVLFNEIQESSQYRSGLALRFARIARVREDKTPAEADTIQTLRQLYEKQFQYKGRLE
ncbi:MAG: ATP-dependent DNA ligase [Anaerolineae bacterium]|nr:ATP-dependent DNA ligase [Anaerolineae bacterium]MDH7473984.1 ATP-dependent DNA ligase [Anaerolineae bacterium]